MDVCPLSDSFPGSDRSVIVGAEQVKFLINCGPVVDGDESTAINFLSYTHHSAGQPFSFCPNAIFNPICHRQAT